MSDRTQGGWLASGSTLKANRRISRPRLEMLEVKALMATLAPIPNMTGPTFLGSQVPLDGGTTGDQTYTVMSTNQTIKASVAVGRFLTIGVNHTSSGVTDPAFTGSLVFKLFEDLTPQTTAKITQLVNEGFYTSPTTALSPNLPTKNFHRIVGGFPNATGFIVQGGSQSGTGSGSLSAPGFPFSDEFNKQLVFNGTGQLAMANAGDDTNDTQFFVSTGMPRFLDFNHTIFAQLVSGQSTLQQMTQVAKSTDGVPVNPVLFTSTTLSNTNPDGVIHLDLTGAAVGQTANVTVIAKDAVGATVSRTFGVTVTANVDAAGAPITERPFLVPPQNQVVAKGQTAIFQVQGAATTPGDNLTYGIGGSISSTLPTFIPIPATSGTATIDSNGIVTVTPAATFTGVINLVAGVRDQINRSTVVSSTVETSDNYDTQKFTLTVINGAMVNLKPIAIPGFAAASAGRNTVVQLLGNTANPGSSQTLQYTILTTPTNGTISNFDTNKGTFTYTPNTGFQGNDTLTFSVKDVGNPQPNLVSDAAVETFVVGGANTGAVRIIGNVLVVTPPPKANLADTSRNTILVNQVGGVLQVTVNGQIDENEPNATDIDQIVVYGSKNSDTITVSQSVTLPTTLDGGHGGTNVITAGAGPAMIFGWFQKRNVLKGGPSNDTIYGKTGAVKFVRSGGNDLYYSGKANLGHRNHTAIFPGKIFNAHPHSPSGTFYRFIGKTLVPIKRV